MTDSQKTNNPSWDLTEPVVVAPSGSTGEAPDDPTLPGLRHLMTPEAVIRRVREVLPGVTTSKMECQITYVRYKPGVNCLVAYRLVEVNETGGSSARTPLLAYSKCYTAADFENAKQKSRAHRWLENTGWNLEKPVIELDDWQSLIIFFPNDFLLEGLRILSDPKKVQRLIYSWVPDFPEDVYRVSDRRLTVAPVRYKPERRAALLCRTRATHRETGARKNVEVYTRIYGDDRGAWVSSLMSDLRQHTLNCRDVRTPRVYGYLAERRLLMIESLPGTVLSDSLERPEPVGTGEMFQRVGRALGNLRETPNSGLSRRVAGDFLSVARATGETLSQLIPDTNEITSEIITELQRRLESLSEIAEGFVHGDFHPGQLIISDKAVGVIDFDRSYNGDFHADLGEMIAHLTLIDKQKGQDWIKDARTELLQGYAESSNQTVSEASLEFWSALRLFLLAVGPFRRLEIEWRQKVREILRICRISLT